MASDDMRKFIDIVNNVGNTEETILEGIFDFFKSDEQKDIEAGEAERKRFHEDFTKEWNKWLGKTQKDKSMSNFVDFLLTKGGLNRDDVDDILGNDKFGLDDMEENPEFAAAQMDDADIEHYIDRTVAHVIKNYSKKTKEKIEKLNSFNASKYRKYLKSMGLENVAGRVINKVKRGDFSNMTDSDTKILAGIAYAIIKSSDL